MQASTHKKIERYLIGIIAVAAVALAVLCITLVQQYRQIRQLDYIAAHHGSLFEALHARGPVGANDAGAVASWMTFDYLNHLFNLPPQYLQTALHITDARYPNLTLHEYASDAGLPQAAFLAQAQQAVRAYFATPQ